MDLSWFQSIFFGLVSGITEIFPVSSQAHRILMLKMFGISSVPAMLQLMIDLGIVAALYYSCQNHIIRIIRAKRLSRVPKRHRKRPLDTTSLMDLSLLKTMVIPVILSFFVYDKVQAVGTKMLWIALLMLANGVILYIPQFFPSANRDSRTMSRVQGLLIGLGGTIGIIPGLSTVAGAYTVSSLCGVDKKYRMNVIFLLTLFVYVGRILFDFLALVSLGLGGITFGEIILCLLSGVVAFGGAMLAVKLLRSLMEEIGSAVFGFYCWGIALFTFIMNLIA